MYELQGKVAIVTGAARMEGIGLACAVALAKSGADVVITGTNRSPDTFPEEEKEAGWQGLASAAGQIEAIGRKVLALTSDATNGQDVQAMVEATLEKFGRIDILVNNAGAAKGPDRVPVVDLPEEVFDSVVMTNLKSTFVCSKYVAREMIKQGQGGKIVNISSIAGRKGIATFSAYSASKFGVIGFTQSLALELARYKITVNAVCPGAVLNHRNRDYGVPLAKKLGISLEQARAKMIADSVPLRRPGTPEEMANMVAFLCSNQADYVTGQTLSVCGGMTM